MSAHQFQTEVSQLLHLIIHSLYSHKEIFLRELVSNASDACDKLKYLTLTDDAFKGYDFNPRIDISFDEKGATTFTIADSGIGMNEGDLVEHLGTIARSGTKSFIEKITGDARKDSNLIGQFGVGFYSCFMVADRVEVITRKAGEDRAYKWISDGKTGYEISDAERATSGTTVTLFLNDEGKEYASKWTTENLIKKYSNHISFPIFLHYEGVRHEGEGDKKKEIREPKVEQVNAASAFWKRPKSELKDEDYNEFYVDRDVIIATRRATVPLRSALESILLQAGDNSPILAIAVDTRGTIIVSSRDELRSEPYRLTHIYDVRDLLPPPDARPSPEDRPDLGGGPEPTVPAYMFGDTPYRVALRKLILNIQSTVAPDTWRQNGGTIGAIREDHGILTIRQTLDNHIAVCQLLQKLRSTTNR